eukprot:724532-Pleurochrysis_carterae.AAC.1
MDAAGTMLNEQAARANIQALVRLQKRGRRESNRFRGEAEGEAKSVHAETSEGRTREAGGMRIAKQRSRDTQSCAA